MIPANLRLMLSLRFSGKNAGVAQTTSENKPDPRTGQAPILFGTEFACFIKLMTQVAC